MSIKLGCTQWWPLSKYIRIATDSNKVVILLALKVILGIQLDVSGEDILQKPHPGQEKACKSLGGWGWLPVNVIPA